MTRVFGRRECEEGMTVAAGGFRVSKEAELLRTGTAKEINAYMKANPGFKPFEQGKNHVRRSPWGVPRFLRAGVKREGGAFSITRGLMLSPDSGGSGRRWDPSDGGRGGGTHREARIDRHR